MSTGVPVEAVRSQTERILASQTFRHAPGLSRFLAYIVEETIQGRAGALKEYSLGVAVFDRGESFDPHTDTIVRVQARRVRSKLEEYYQAPRPTDSVLIELPKGSYIPEFRPAEPPPQERPRHWLRTAAVALGLILIGAGTYWRLHVTAGATLHSVRSLAVLPLDNMSGQPEQDYFADGLTEALTTDLSSIQSLRVVARTSAMSYKGSKKPLSTIARELQVDAFVEGSVFESDGRVRVTAQLIDAATNRHLWAQTYERDLRDILTLQSELAQSIALEVRGVLSPAARSRLAAVKTVDPEALRLYLRGRYLANQATEPALKASVSLFEQSAGRDPSYALAYAGLASSYTQLSGFYLAPRDVMPKARSAALKALELDSNLASAHISLAKVQFFYDWDRKAAEHSILRALELNPNSADAHSMYSNYFQVLGDHNQSMAHVRRAEELDPFSVPVRFDSGWAYLTARRYGEGLELSRRTLERDPGAALVRGLLGLSYTMNGNSLEGMRELRTAVHDDDSPMVRLFLALAYALGDKRSEARRELVEAKKIARRRYVCAYEIASVHAVLGERGEAIQWFERAIADRCDCMVWLTVEPWLESFRSDPAYAGIVRQVGLAATRE